MTDGPPSGRDRPPAPGALGPRARLGKYELLRQVGRGGNGVVYEALDTALGRKVALKIPSADPGAAEAQRFLAEARLAAALPKHPHVVTVYDAGVAEGVCYIAMEFVEGRSMGEWRRAAAPDLPEQVRLLREVALAVEHAHRHGVIHRDLKPANILVGADGRPRVTDFGLAVPVDGTAPDGRGAERQVRGTPSYMSPEQARGLETVDPRSDVYSLGVMLYEMVAGHVPFRGRTAVEILRKAVNDPVPPSPRFTAPGGHARLRRALEGVCRKALEKDRALRYSTAGEFAEDLGRALGAESEGALRIRRRRARRFAVPAAAGVAVVVAVFLALGGRSPDRIGAELERADRLLAQGDDVGALAAYDRVLALDGANARAAQGKRKADERLRLRLQREKEKAAEAAAAEARRRAEEEARRRNEEMRRELEARLRSGEEEQLKLKVEQARLEAARAVAEVRARAAEAAARKAAAGTPVPSPPAPPAPVRDAAPAAKEAKEAPPAPVPDPAPPAPKAAARRAPPAEAQRREAEKTVRELFKADYARRGASDLAALGRKLLGEGARLKEESAMKFALLSEARELAAQAGDVETAFAAVDELTGTFDVEALALKTAVLAAAARAVRTSEGAAALAEAGLRLADEAVATNAFDAATAALSRAEAAARAAQDPALLQSVLARGREVAGLRDEYRQLRTALKTLEEKPDDPAANLSVGLYRAFSRDDWARGLPHLAKGADSALAALAVRESESPAGAEAQAALGDAWREAAEKRTGSMKGRFQTRALHWYQKSLSGLEGLARLKVEAHVEALAKSLAGTDSWRRGLVFWFEPGRDPAGGVRDLVFGAKAGGAPKTVVEGGLRAFPFPGGVVEYPALAPVRAIQRQGSIFVWLKCGAGGGTVATRVEPEAGVYDFWVWVGDGPTFHLYSNWPEHQGSQSMAIPSGQWTHAGVVWDERTVVLYVDGREAGKGEMAAEGIPRRRASRLQIGSDPSGAGSGASGFIGSVMIYDRALSSHDALLLFASSRNRFR